ncbi:hypothetical protein [Shinella sp.]|jgi:hypothetical protein|uniref:hypothetical protein n=1 Tax=Shinella sp. TaxID=1870904 RepID=UPI003F71C989
MAVGIFGRRFDLSGSFIRPLAAYRGLLPVHPRGAKGGSPVFVSAQNGVWNPSATAIPKPLFTKAGDWLFAVFVLQDPTYTITTVPEKWVRVVSSPFVWIYRKRATGDEPIEYVFGASAASVTGYTMALRGEMLGITKHNFNSIVSKPAEPEVFSGQIPVQSGRMLFSVLGIRNNGANMLSGPAGMTQRATQFTGAAPRGAIFSKVVTSTGSSGNKVFRVETPYHSIAALFEVGSL